MTSSQRVASIFTDRLLGGGGEPYRLTSLLPGTSIMMKGNIVPTTGTRFSRSSQPDQPKSCRRCTPICTLTTSMPMKIRPMQITPAMLEMAMMIPAMPNSPADASTTTRDQAR